MISSVEHFKLEIIMDTETLRYKITQTTFHNHFIWQSSSIACGSNSCLLIFSGEDRLLKLKSSTRMRMVAHLSHLECRITIAKMGRSVRFRNC